MYSLDVNFLKDRNLEEKPSSRPKLTSTKAFMPLLVGLGVALIPLMMVGGFWYWANNSNAELDQKIADENEKISKIDGQLAESRRITEQTNKITAETQALASVFNQIKPWSATLQDLRDRIPPNVQVDGIAQTEAALTPVNTPTPTPTNKATPNAPNQPPLAPTPTFTNKLEIVGHANSFDDVNDFVLALQRSSFLEKGQTQLVSAELKENPTQIERPKITTKKPTTAQVTYELPKVVAYRIQTSMSNMPASDLLRELDRKGAVGLVTRIRTLQEQGINTK